MFPKRQLPGSREYRFVGSSNPLQQEVIAFGGIRL
jgi:hypothetical protein